MGAVEFQGKNSLRAYGRRTHAHVRIEVVFSKEKDAHIGVFLMVDDTGLEPVTLRTSTSQVLDIFDKL